MGPSMPPVRQPRERSSTRATTLQPGHRPRTRTPSVVIRRMVPPAARCETRDVEIDAAVPARVPVADRAPDRDFAPALASLQAAPKSVGRLEAIVVRPTVETRRTVEEAQVDVDGG